MLTEAAITDTSDSLPAGSPGSFAISTPAPADTGVSTQTSLSWQPAADAAYYDLVVSTRSDLSEPLVSVSGLTGTSYVPTRAWPGGTTLYLRVTAVNGVGATAITGSPISFTTRAATPGVLVDDFDTYADDAALQAAWTANSGGDPITPTLGDPGEGSGHSMVLSFGTGPNGYSGVIHNLASAQDWSGTGRLKLWLKPGRDASELNVQFTANGSFWEHKLTLSGTEGARRDHPMGRLRTATVGTSGRHPRSVERDRDRSLPDGADGRRLDLDRLHLRRALTYRRHPPQTTRSQTTTTRRLDRPRALTGRDHLLRQARPTAAGRVGRCRR